MGLSKFLVPLSFFGTIACGAVLIKDYMAGGRYEGTERMAGRTVVITGANSGVGKETARSLAHKGARVILACRDMEACNAACKEIMVETLNKQLECRRLDLASFASIRACAKNLIESEPHIDVLINNAGVMVPPKGLTADGLELQMGVNHFGHFLLTYLLADKLKAAASEAQPSRVVFLSSLAHTRGSINFDDLNSEQSYDARAVYGMSKLANVLCANEFAKRLKDSHVTVNSCHPGVVRTELGRHMGIFKSSFSRAVLSPLMWMLLKTPAQGAQTSLRLACDPALKDVTGKYFSDCVEKEPAPAALDEATAKRLWAISEAWTRANLT